MSGPPAASPDGVPPAALEEATLDADASTPLTRFWPAFEPRQVLLFSGHMVDAPGRPSPRFPAFKVDAAAARIARALDAIGAGPADLGLTQGAAGGDLLFAEACVDRGVRVQLLLPLRTDEFIAQSILPSDDGPAWLARFEALQRRLRDPPRDAPTELGPLAPGADAFERANLWLLHSAVALGPARLRLICLWDGASGDGPGGTRHMIDEARRHGAGVTWIDTRTL